MIEHLSKTQKVDLVHLGATFSLKRHHSSEQLLQPQLAAGLPSLINTAAAQ